MIKFTTIDFFLRAIPESFVIVFSTYAFSKVRINKRRYILSSIFLAIIAFSLRQLPINYGVHTIFGIIGLITLNVYVNKFDIITTVRGVVSTFTLEFVFEAINLIIIQYIFKMNLNIVLKSIKYRLIFSTFALLAFASLILVYYRMLLKRKELRVV